MRFWRRKACPKVWETGLLKKIEKKKGDLSPPGNYRGIMLLGVPYKVSHRQHPEGAVRDKSR
jgi:hypothetical protein